MDIISNVYIASMNELFYDKSFNKISIWIFLCKIYQTGGRIFLSLPPVAAPEIYQHHEGKGYEDKGVADFS